ncbi:MAG: oligosaccharide flippase family protein [Candidatus Paceibacterota bacterium]
MIDFIKNKTHRLLRWSEKYTKTDMVYLAQGGFWLNLATTIGSFSSLALVYVFGNYLSPEVYGNYRYILSVYGLLTIVTLTGFNAAVTRSVAKDNEGDIIKGLKIQILSSLLGSLMAFTASIYYWLNGNATLSIGLLIIGLVLPLMEPLDMYNSLLNGRKLFKISSLVSIFVQVLVTIILITVVLLGGSIVPLLLAYFISYTALRLFFFIVIKKAYQKNDQTSPDLMKNGFNFSVINILSNISGQIDKIILFQLVGAKELAMFSFAIAPAEQLKGLFKNLSSLMLPKFSTRNEKELRENLNKKVLVVGATALLISLAYIISAPLLIKIFLPKYTDITLMSQIFSLSLIGVMVIPINSAMNSIPKMKALYVSNILSPVVNILMVLTLIPLFGLWGAILARAFGRIINIIGTYLVFEFVKD